MKDEPEQRSNVIDLFGTEKVNDSMDQDIFFIGRCPGCGSQGSPVHTNNSRYYQIWICEEHGLAWEDAFVHWRPGGTPEEREQTDKLLRQQAIRIVEPALDWSDFDCSKKELARIKKRLRAETPIVTRFTS